MSGQTFAQFVACFFGGDAVDSKAAFNIVQETEMLARLFDGNDI